jgi:hypothetical protein
LIVIPNKTLRKSELTEVLLPFDDVECQPREALEESPGEPGVYLGVADDEDMEESLPQ